MAAILYSFRRCPYALRARLALAAAGLEPGPQLELREVALRAKPPELLQASTKGTVPVLVLPDGTVLEESLAIMHWALRRADPQGWWRGWDPADLQRMQALIAENDGPFKHHLDRFKYPDRYPGETWGDHRLAALAILRRWQQQLRPGGGLLGPRLCLADGALLPFVRQFRGADTAGFDAEPGLGPLRAWLQRFEASAALAAVLAEPWGPRRPWRSPSWLYHLALADDWRACRASGEAYRISTRGQSLEQVGFVHLSQAHQVEATAARFYGDLPPGAVQLLWIDPLRLEAAGLEVRLELAGPAGELFPHLYGPLPQQAVLRAEPLFAALEGQQIPH
jgi:glutathione S-transferase